MKIHFIANVDGNKDDYKNIVQIIQKLGHTLVTDHFLNRTLDEIKSETPAEAELYSKKSQRWMKQADVVIFEVTAPDVSVGYEVAMTLNYLKPVIILYRNDVALPPNSLKGVDSDKLQVLGYSEDTLEEILSLAIEYAGEVNDVRFNFFISPSIGNYLDWISKNKKIPRSVYLRTLIERDMSVNDEYNAS